MSVACFLSRRTDLLCRPRFAAGEALSLVIHFVSCRGSWKIRLKQNFIFSFVHWKKEFNPLWIHKPSTTILVFFYRSEDWTAIEDSSQESFQGSQLPILYKGCSYGFSLIHLTGKQYKMKEHRKQSPIPFFLQIL